jgi:peptide/nickel transport system substrate-binding protein
MQNKRLLLFRFSILLVVLAIIIQPILNVSSQTIPISPKTQMTASVNDEIYPVIKNPITSDLRVRQAIADCTDRRALAEAAYPDYTDPQIDALMMDSFYPSTYWAYSKPAAQYPFDPTLGGTLLDQAGWTLASGAIYRTNSAGEPLVFKLTTTNSSLREAYTAVFQQQMLNCGVEVLLFYTPGNWFFGTQTGVVRRDFELGAFAWTYETDPNKTDMVSLYGCDSVPSAQNGWSGLNSMGWCNPIASQAAVQADNTALTQDQRIPYFAIIQEQYANDMPSLPLFLRGDDSGAAFEHLDFNQFTPTWPIYLPLVTR